MIILLCNIKQSKDYACGIWYNGCANFEDLYPFCPYVQDWYLCVSVVSVCIACGISHDKLQHIYSCHINKFAAIFVVIVSRFIWWNASKNKHRVTYQASHMRHVFSVASTWQKSLGGEEYLFRFFISITTCVAYISVTWIIHVIRILYGRASISWSAS